MNKKPILLLFALIPIIAQTQIAGIRTKENLVLYDSIIVKPGDTLYLGKGSDTRGNFIYIYQPANFLVGMEESSLDRRYAGKFFKVKHFRKEKSKKTGEKMVGVVSYGGLNYVADIENAIDAGEIIAINSRRFGKEAVPVEVKSSSIADELAKLKKLYDDGAITKDEYEQAKKKLLGN